MALPSALFAEGLGLRAGRCPWRAPPQTASIHLLTVVEAVRGPAALRVSASGEPTCSGQDDGATLVVGPTRTPLTPRGRSPRVADPSYGAGTYVSHYFPPSAYWYLQTDGHGAFDVGSFTVDLRYLAVQER